MILCRKPFPIYHVDALGALGVLGLVLAGWWLAVVPWRQTCAGYRELGQRRASLEAELQARSERLDQVQQDLSWLEGVVQAQAVEVPRADSVPQLLREMTDVAKEAQIELLSVVPQPAVAEGAYLVSEIQLAGRGGSRDFIRFLDRLAQRNPFQALTNCAVRRSATAADPACELSWTVRLYMLPAVETGAEGT